MSWYREWRLRQVEEKIADLKFDRERWGFSYRPSEKAAISRRIERLKSKRDRLREAVGS